MRSSIVGTWTEFTNRATGKSYFCNDATGETTWERPHHSEDTGTWETLQDPTRKEIEAEIEAEVDFSGTMI